MGSFAWVARHHPTPTERSETMSVDTTAAPDTAAPSTRARLAVLAVVLGATSVAAVAGGLLWPEPAAGGETYSYADIASGRELWWGLLTGLAAMQVLNIPLQALATLVLVRR